MITQFEVAEVASGTHGEIAVAISTWLYSYVRPKKLGRVFDGRTTFNLGTAVEPNKKEPDVSFVKLERLPQNIDDVVPLAPDLVVEIISGSDIWKEIVNKAKMYLSAGVELIWIVDPYTQSVSIFKAETPLDFQIAKGEDELDGENVIPGFRLKVKAIFDGIIN